jgi:ADP-ribosyl-[dinitrogen reductase] hydrolase
MVPGPSSREEACAPSDLERAKGAVVGLAAGEAVCGGGQARAMVQSLALAGASLQRPPWSLGAWACWLLAGQRKGVWRDGDRFLNEALMRLRRGEPPERVGFPTPHIGPAARIGPLGVVLRRDPAHLIRAVFESSLLTHADLRAAAFAFAVAYAVARLVDGDELVDVVTVLPSAVRGVEDSWAPPRHPAWERDQGQPHAVSDTMRDVFHSFPADRRGALPAEHIRDAVCVHALTRFSKQVSAHPNGSLVLLGGMHALAMALLSPEPAPSVLAQIAAQGGKDAGLVGAIAGTLLGARYGTRWRVVVPERVEQWADAIARGEALEGRDAFVGGTWEASE